MISLTAKGARRRSFRYLYRNYTLYATWYFVGWLFVRGKKWGRRKLPNIIPTLQAFKNNYEALQSRVIAMIEHLVEMILGIVAKLPGFEDAWGTD